jgi:putative flippase GtrA
MALKHRYRNIVEARRASSRPAKRKTPSNEGAELGRFRRFARFAGSSLVCTALDQVVAGVLFVALRKPMADMGFVRILLGTVIARVLSQTLNYAVNRRVVFSAQGGKKGNRPSRRESLPRFLALSAGILSLSIIGVYLLHTYAGVQESIAKLLMDFSLFFLNYYLQHNWVFTTEPSIRPRRAKRKKSSR